MSDLPFADCDWRQIWGKSVKANSKDINHSSKAKRVISALGIATLSILLVSACGNKSSSTSAPAAAAPVVPATQGTLLEESLPGNSLLNGTTSTSAFKTMSQNLTGLVNFTVVEQKAYDYMITPPTTGATSTFTRQEGKSQNPIPVTYQGQAGSNGIWGRMAITMVAPPNVSELARTFIFQYQLNIYGLILTSTDQVALFKATNSSPYATDFLKVNYTTKNPTIQRFRISQLSPFPVSGIIPQNAGNNLGGSWLSVISQKITTSFQYQN
jgi:hypothetical protein